MAEFQRRAQEWQEWARRREEDRERDREREREERPQNGEATARFVKWTEGRDGRTPAMLLMISDDKGTETATIICPNTAKGRISPDRHIAELAEKLKIGDVVEVDYTYFKGRTTVRRLKLEEAASDSDRQPFTFVRVTEVRRGKDKFLGVSAKRGKLSWTFLVPNEQVDTATLSGADGKPLGEGTMTAPAANILKGLATLRNGDLISLTYRPKDYQFVLTDLRVSRLAETGKFERLSGRTVNGKRHNMAMFRVGTKTLALVVPLPKGDNVTTDNAARMTALLKDMRQWQSVNVTYRREDGIAWLDDLTIKP